MKTSVVVALLLALSLAGLLTAATSCPRGEPAAHPRGSAADRDLAPLSEQAAQLTLDPVVTF